MYKKVLVILFITSLTLSGVALTNAIPEQNLVTISESTQINEAVQILEQFATKFESKKMINQSSYSGTIGIPVNNLPWRQAAEMIALKNNLVLTEQPGFISFNNIVVLDSAPQIAEDALNVGLKQVRINAIVLYADRSYLKALGVDWSTLFQGKVRINANFMGADQVPGSIFSLGAERGFLLDGYPVDLTALLNTIESNQKGSVIAKPNIIVSSGKHGFIQVGEDISIKTVDEAGNIKDTFFATGVIMNVLPTVVKVGDREVVHLKVSIERSTGKPGNISTIITKSKSETELVLYDGEEAVMGGLYDTDHVNLRSGIPILKDLPWWVLGIRYITGYNKVEDKDRELVIILKTNIVENAFDRAAKADLNTPASKVPPEAGDWGYLDK